MLELIVVVIRIRVYSLSAEMRKVHCAVQRLLGQAGLPSVTEGGCRKPNAMRQPGQLLCVTEVDDGRYPNPGEIEILPPAYPVQSGPL
jgi:hypothetical protein